MSFIHYLFLGHFEHDGEVVRFSKTTSASVYRPVVRHPIDTEAIKAVLQEVKGARVDDLAFPDDWMVWLSNGYLVSEQGRRELARLDMQAGGGSPAETSPGSPEPGWRSARVFSAAARPPIRQPL